MHSREPGGGSWGDLHGLISPGILATLGTHGMDAREPGKFMGGINVRKEAWIVEQVWTWITGS